MEARDAASLFQDLCPEFSEATVVTIGNAAKRAELDCEYRAVVGIRGVDSWQVSTRQDWPTTVPKGTKCLHCQRNMGGRIAYPVALHYDQYRGRYRTHGPFCEPECSLGFLVDRNKPQRVIGFTR